MPYISKATRDKVADGYDLDGLIHREPGTLNFMITVLLTQYVKVNGLSYATINEVMGVMSSAQAEFYRRVAVPYETQKIADNGDVYPVELTQGGQK